MFFSGYVDIYGDFEEVYDYTIFIASRALIHGENIISELSARIHTSSALT